MIILASGSPRRKELLSLLNIPFCVIPAKGEEIIPQNLPPSRVAAVLAQQKALEIAQKYPKDTVIGADTIVVLGNEIFGKPKNKSDAFKMLLALSGKTHHVITAVSVVKNNINLSFFQKTYVTFYSLSKKDICKYIDTKEPFDKAGAYGIQGAGATLIKGIKGDYYNVVGLPIARLKKILKFF